MENKINRKKLIRKEAILKVITWMIWVIAIVMIIGGCWTYYTYLKEKERLAQEPYYTAYKLDSMEMAVLDGQYHVKITPGVEKLSKKDNKDIWPDFRFVKIEATQDTEVVVTVLNYWLFDKRDKWNQEGWKKAEEYGITTDNRLTEEWVIEHPREAIDIMRAMSNRGDDFLCLWDGIYSLYEELTGIHIEYDIWK